MTLKENTSPWPNELPSHYADRLSNIYSANASDEHKKNLGQYFTPLPIANLLADFGRAGEQRIRILDPGCGIGILSTVLCEKLALAPTPVTEIDLVAFETDIAILPYAENCLTYLASWLRLRKVELTYFLCKNDFILHNSHILAPSADGNGDYDIIISNPPYFKLPKGDERVKAARAVIYGQTNIYSIFMVIAAKLLKDNGQLIFITPRSFCSGNYFRLFREVFFNMVDLEGVHLFNSRKTAFKKDKVLQENVVVVARRKSIHHSRQMLLPFEPGNQRRVFVSSSEGVNDLPNRRVKAYSIDSVLDMTSAQKVLYLPVSESDEKILYHFSKWDGSFSKYKLKISTGPVVDFRNTDYIRLEAEKDTVPLLWLHNIYPMTINWPTNQEKGKIKGQYILFSSATKSRLILNRNLVLLRRFSAKDDKNRLIASPYLRKSTPHYSQIGIENHLNYIYHTERELSDEEVTGIAVLLNSRLFDLYFRIFNGNINVSATELRDFPLPDFSLIINLGKEAISQFKNHLSIDIEELIKRVFNINLDLPKLNG